MAALCLCCSGKDAASCCHRFVTGAIPARTPEQLMRSRYVAYALGGCGDYLLATWHPASAQGLSAPMLSAKGPRWCQLEVLAKSQHGDEGMVEFNAWYEDENGERTVLHERSIFSRVAGRWLYVGGEVDITAGIKPDNT